MKVTFSATGGGRLLGREQACFVGLSHIAPILKNPYLIRWKVRFQRVSSKKWMMVCSKKLTRSAIEVFSY
jgi:hypothetical protein